MKHKYLLILVLILAFMLRLPLLGGSFWLDEAAQALESTRPLGQQLNLRDDFQPPLLHVILHFTLLVSHSESWARSISLLSGLMTIAALYLLLKETTSEKAALVGALFLALDPFHIYFSQELRPYSLATMFAVLSWIALIKNKRTGFIAATTLGLYSMYLYPFVVFSQLIYLWFEKRSDFKKFLLPFIIAIVFFLPWLPSFLGQLNAGTSLKTTLPGWADVVATPQWKALPMVLGKFIVGQVEFKDSLIYVMLAGVVAVLFIVSLAALWKEKKQRYLIYWFTVVVVGSWLISFVIPVIQPKRVMIALPALISVLAIYVSKPKREILIGLVSLILILFTGLYFSNAKYQRENWRSVIHQIEADAGNKKSVALFVFPEAFAPWRWYANGTVATLSTGTLRVDTSAQLESKIVDLHLYRRIYYFEYLTTLSDPENITKSWLVQQEFRKIRDIDGGSLGFVRVYDLL